MNSIASIAIAALVALTVVLTGLTGLTNIPAEGYAGLSLLLGGFAVTAWGRAELELEQANEFDPAQAASTTPHSANPAKAAADRPEHPTA